MKNLLLGLWLSFFLIGCSSMTVINSNPQGAQVFLGEELLGETPFTYSDRKIFNSETEFVLKKDGFADYRTSIRRNEVTDWGACVGGVFTLVPFLWIKEYKAERTYDLASLTEENLEMESPEEISEDEMIGTEKSTKPLEAGKKVIPSQKKGIKKDRVRKQ
jgi:hypothetical protein